MRPGPSAGTQVVCLYFPAAIPLSSLQSLGEACLRLSSQVALRGNEAVFIETGGSRLLYSEDSLRARLLALGLRFQTAENGASAARSGTEKRRSAPLSAKLRLGWGAHAGEAWARAKYGQASENLEDWPLQALECYASPFSENEEVSRHMLALVKALRDLGVPDLGAFLRLPPGGWGERFGPNAAVLRERLEGRLTVGWPRFEPEERLGESQDLRDVETQSSGIPDEALSFHLKRLCDRVSARLRGRTLRAAALALELRFETVRGLLDAAPWVLELKLSRPVAEPSQLRKLMQERLETEARRRPLPRNLEGLGLAVTATAPGFSPQRDAFDRHEEAVEARDGLLARLAQKLGERGIFQAELVPRHSPERAWRRAQPRPLGPPGAGPLRTEGQPKTEGLAVSPVPRPTRLARHPLLLARTGDWLLYWAGAAKSRRWRTLDWLGPERIAGDWWRPETEGLGEAPQARDYWRVGTAEGMDLWVFCRQGDEARSGALWLQGWWA